MKRVKILLLIFTTLISLLCLLGCTGNGYIPEPSQGNITPGGMAYCWYGWPWISEKGFDDFEISLTVDVDPGNQATYYWAHQFGFRDGDGGYMGLQTKGYKQGKCVGKMTIFSIWDALDAEPGPGASCEEFGGEGEGWSCRKKLNWIKGNTYNLSIRLEGVDLEQNKWWGAYIVDTTASNETFLGKIKVPASWKGLDNSSVIWVEYYGKVSDCNSIPYAEARFEQPKANNGTQIPQKLTIEEGTTCPNAASAIPLEDKGILFMTGNSLL